MLYQPSTHLYDNQDKIGIRNLCTYTMCSLSLSCVRTPHARFPSIISSKKRKNETNADNKIHAKTSLFRSTSTSSPQLNLNFCCVLTFETTTSTDENKIFHSILHKHNLHKKGKFGRFVWQNQPENYKNGCDKRENRFMWIRKSWSENLAWKIGYTFVHTYIRYTTIKMKYY